MRSRAVLWHRPRGVILLTAIRASSGTTLLLMPRAVRRTVGAGRSDTFILRVTRILGGRELVQAVVAVRHRSQSSTVA